MGICKNCHRARRKSYLARHERNCMPSKDDMAHYQASKSSSQKTQEMNKKAKAAAA